MSDYQYKKLPKFGENYNGTAKDDSCQKLTNFEVCTYETVPLWERDPIFLFGRQRQKLLIFAAFWTNISGTF